MTKRTKQVVYTVVAVLALSALALPKILNSSQKEPAAKKGGGTSAAAVVKAYVAGRAKLDDRLFVTGTVLPNEQIDLHSEVPGKIVRINFREGAMVSKGSLLVKINDADLQASLRKAIYRRQLLEQKEQQQKQLLQRQAVSQAEYDIAANDLNIAASEIELVRAQIAKTEIRAPFSGMIGLRHVSQGSYISPTTEIATLQSRNPVKIEFSVPEKYAMAVRTGNQITFTVQGDSTAFQGKVYAVEPNIDQSTRTLQVRALCPNSEGRIAPGAFAEIRLALNQIDDALMIPTQAVIPDMQGKKVFVSKDGKAESRPVVVGIRTDKNVQILEGLAPGDTVITSGILQIKPGTMLKISEVEAGG